MKRFALAWVAPPLLLLGLAVWPLATGERTLVMRDVLNSHLALRSFGAEALARGELPLVDPTRGGGQPYVGNPNALPLYPTGLLALAGSTLWALNAHFWLHWLFAPWALFVLARRLGLAREPAWVAGVAYAFSGYFLSQLNLANLMAGAALAPALAAAALAVGDPANRRRATVGVALVWALLLVGGDPMTALLAAGAAGLAVALVRGRRAGWPRLAGAGACGTLLAAPQWVEMLRVLGSSYRGFWGYRPDEAVSGWAPALLLDWLWPLPFGRPDQLVFWGGRFTGGELPLFHSVAPGVLVLALVAAAADARDRRAALGAALAGAGLAAVAGASLAAGWLAALPGSDLLRFPVKIWIWVAMGGALLAGVGAERWLSGTGRRAAGLALLALGFLHLAAWLALGPAGTEGGDLLARLAAGALAPAALAAERLRLTGLALSSLVLTGLLGLAWGVARRRPAAALAAALALHAGAQLLFLAPLRATDAAAPYAAAPEIAGRLPAGAVVAHGFVGGLLAEPDLVRAEVPGQAAALQRFFHAGLAPWAGREHGFRYELDPSPEGLDQFMTLAVAVGLRNLPEPRQLRLLRATGVEFVLHDRPFADLAPFASAPLGASRLLAFRVPDPLPEAAVVGEVRSAPHLNAALELVTAPRFDPRRAAVVPGSAPPRLGPPGRLLALRVGDEQIAAEVDSEAGGLFVARRAWLPIYRATVDGRAVQPVVANLTRLAVELPPGRHRVRLWVDRRPLGVATAVAALGALALAVLAARAGRPRPAKIAPL